MKLRAARLRYLLISSLMFILAACATDVQEPLTNVDQTKVEEAVKLFRSDPEGKFIETFQALTTDEMSLWIEGVHEDDLAEFESLAANPYVEKEFLRESGLSLDDPSLGRTPDDMAERIDTEGTYSKRAALTPEELTEKRSDVQYSYQLRKTMHELGVETFGRSFNNLAGDEWDLLEEEYAKTEQGLMAQQACRWRAGTSRGGTPYVGRASASRTLEYIGTVTDPNSGDCDYYYRVSGFSSTVRELVQNPRIGFDQQCLANLANLGNVRSYPTFTYSSTGSWYILGPQFRIDTVCLGARDFANSAGAR